MKSIISSNPHSIIFIYYYYPYFMDEKTEAVRDQIA